MMNVIAIPSVEDPSQTHHPLWSEGYELLFGSIATILVLGLLFWKAGPALKKMFTSRTERVQEELDESAAALAEAGQEAQRISQAKGDIEAERRRLLAEADERAEALLTEGRARLTTEIADLEAKADADIAAVSSRASDELRGEIARLSGAAADRVVEESLDDATRQRLIEDFISKVGQQRPAEVTR